MIKPNSTLGIILLIFIGLIVGTVLLSTIADQIFTTSTVGQPNETITFTDRNASTTNTDVFNLVFFGNSTTNTNDGAINIDAEVNYTTPTDAVSVITLDQATFGNGTYKAIYQYYPSGYVRDSQSRTILSLVIIFFSLAILIGAAGYVYKMWGDDLKELFM